MNPNARICPLSETDTGRRVPSLVPDGSSEGRMQYAPTAYRKKRPFLPIYLGASKKEKELGVEGRSPLCRGVLHTPHRWPRRGTNAEDGVDGRSPLCRGVLHTPHKWPRQGTNAEDGVEGRSPVCRAQKHTPHKWPRQGTNAGRRVPSFLLLIEEKKAKEDQGLCRGRGRWGGCV